MNKYEFSWCLLLFSFIISSYLYFISIKVWKREENVENIPDKSDKTIDDKKKESGVRNSQNNDVDPDVIKQDERIKGEQESKSNENRVKKVEDRSEQNLKPENKNLTEKSSLKVESKDEPKKANEKIIDKENDDVVIPKANEKIIDKENDDVVTPITSDKVQEKGKNEDMLNKGKREKSDQDNPVSKKITKIADESNTILLEEVIKILKNDLALIMQKPADLIRIEKIQSLHIDLEKIETSLNNIVKYFLSLNNKSTNLKNIASWLFTDLNLTYYELYEHYRNSTITVYKNNSFEVTPISFNSKLDELCILGIKLFSTYLSDDSRTLNSMINMIVNFHLTLNFDEKPMEDFSQNSFPEYEQFIGKFGNPEQKEKFSKLKKKFLFTSEINNGKNNQLPNNVSSEKNKSPRNNSQNDRNVAQSNNKNNTEKDSNQRVQSSSKLNDNLANGQSSNRETNKDRSPGNNVAKNTDKMNHKANTSSKNDPISPVCKDCLAKAQSTSQSSNQKRSSGDNVDYKKDGTPYVDHTTRTPLRNNHIDFKTLKERATSSVLHNKYETFDDRFLLSYLEFILATIMDEFMFIEKHFIKIPIIVVSRKELEEIQNKFYDHGKFKINTIKKILSCLIKSYEETHRSYTIILYNNERCPEQTINHLVSAMTLYCEMMIELYEVFQNQLDKPYDIINLINNKQIHLKKLKDKANFYSKWLDYYHEFVLKYGNKKQKKDITDVLNSHWNFSS